MRAAANRSHQRPNHDQPKQTWANPPLRAIQATNLVVLMLAAQNKAQYSWKMQGLWCYIPIIPGNDSDEILSHGVEYEKIWWRQNQFALLVGGNPPASRMMLYISARNIQRQLVHILRTAGLDPGESVLHAQVAIQFWFLWRDVQGRLRCLCLQGRV